MASAGEAVGDDPRDEQPAAVRGRRAARARACGGGTRRRRRRRRTAAAPPRCRCRSPARRACRRRVLGWPARIVSSTIASISSATAAAKPSAVRVVRSLISSPRIRRAHAGALRVRVARSARRRPPPARRPRAASSCSGDADREARGRRSASALRPCTCSTLAVARAPPPRALERRGELRRAAASAPARRRPVKSAIGPLLDQPAAMDDDDVVDGLLRPRRARGWRRAPCGPRRPRRAGSRAASGCPAGRGRWRARRGPAPPGRRAASPRAPSRWRMPIE